MVTLTCSAHVGRMFAHKVMDDTVVSRNTTWFFYATVTASNLPHLTVFFSSERFFDLHLHLLPRSVQRGIQISNLTQEWTQIREGFLEPIMYM